MESRPDNDGPWILSSRMVGDWGPPPRPQTTANMGWDTAIRRPSSLPSTVHTHWGNINFAPPNIPIENESQYPGGINEVTSPEQITPTRLRKFLAGETVILYVGPDREEFKLSKDLLCYVSPFFHAAFKGEFKEGQKQTMELLEDDVEAFDRIVSYMYRGVFGNENRHPNQIAVWRPAVKLSTVIYVLELSERLQIPDMKTAALADLEWALHSQHATEPTADDVALAFNILPADSKAIIGLVDFVADDFLTSNDNFDREGLGEWRFARLTDDVEEFGVAFMLSLRRLAVRRLRNAHDSGSNRYPNCRDWYDAKPHDLTFCPFASWRLPLGSWK